MTETSENLTIRVSAPGKVILHGEHAVVFGKLAIAAALDLRTSVVLQEKRSEKRGGKLEVQFVDLKLRKKFDIEEIRSFLETNFFPSNFTFETPDVLDHTEYLAVISKLIQSESESLAKNSYVSLLSFLYLYFGIVHSANIPIEPLTVTVKTDLSLGSGTGSSASYMVSLAGCLIHYVRCKKILKDSQDADAKWKLLKTIADSKADSKNGRCMEEKDLSLISQWAFRGERMVHGNPSGIDNTVCTYGAFVSFRRGRAPFGFKSRSDIRALLVDTRVPKDTAKMVQRVAELRQRRLGIISPILEAIDQLTDEALEVFVRLGEVEDKKVKIIEEYYENLAELADLNQDLLRTLTVSHSAIDEVIQTLKHNNLHGKLTGAGGGGYVLALIPPHVAEEDLNDVINKLSGQGYQPFVTKLGGTGIRIDEVK